MGMEDVKEPSTTCYLISYNREIKLPIKATCQYHQYIISSVLMVYQKLSALIRHHNLYVRIGKINLPLGSDPIKTLAHTRRLF